MSVENLHSRLTCLWVFSFYSFEDNYICLQPARYFKNLKTMKNSSTNNIINSDGNSNNNDNNNKSNNLV